MVQASLPFPPFFINSLDDVSFVDDRKQGEGQNQVLKDTERLKWLGTLTGNLATIYLSALTYGPQKQLDKRWV